MNTPTVEDANRAIATGIMLGSGSARNVYWIRGSRWAFKVDCEDYNSNRNEYNNWNALRKIELPANVRVPEMHMLDNGVVAVEYIDGEHPDTHCWAGDHECDYPSNCWLTELLDKDIENIVGFGDISRANVIMTDGVVYIIDLEF